MSELSMGEEGLGLKPGLAELKLEPGIHRFVKFSNNNLKNLLRDGDVEPLVDTPHTAARKSDKIRQIVNEHTSAESQKTVESILDQVLYQLSVYFFTCCIHQNENTQVSLLSPLDKLLLYLKLPSGRPADADPLRQPLNPLGSRSEIQLTINWIRTHLEEDPQISLPKHEVYDEYIGYCTTNSVKPLSTADFGKVMKQVYPQVRGLSEEVNRHQNLSHDELQFHVDKVHCRRERKAFGKKAYFLANTSLNIVTLSPCHNSGSPTKAWHTRKLALLLCRPQEKTSFGLSYHSRHWHRGQED